MVVAKENQKKKTISSELKKEIKAFFKQGLSVKEVTEKLGIPKHVAYYYSPLSKRRKARIKYRRKGSGDTYSDIIETKIAELEAEKERIDLQIETLKGLL